MILRHRAAREGTLLTFLRRELGLSSSETSRLKFTDAYFVNEMPVHTNHIVHIGDEIAVRIEENTPDFPAEDGPLSILYEDEAVIALDKPAGMLMHPSFNRNEGTLANRLLGYYRRTGQRCAIHPVSRLDRDTFGVVLLAKNAHTHAILCKAMQQSRVQKTYRALVYGASMADGGVMDYPIARSAPDSLLRCVRADGKPSVSDFKVLERRPPCALLRLTPHTGRTHQLRVHCAHEGFPIVGDVQYGTEESIAFSQRNGYAYQQLCAAALRFPHPLSGETVRLYSHQNIVLPKSFV